ncbi:unnamed protein product [Brassica oleracea var. botrytis]|uniref:(rape) hypothetical protein n=1 Tax=Brassica napus TaxID=3708 RepID=A0A816JWI2_BRANA|nr:unnamed protein product [Brassica napus]
MTSEAPNWASKKNRRDQRNAGGREHQKCGKNSGKVKSGHLFLKK